MTRPDQYANVRYVVDDVQEAVDFYTTRLGFTAELNAAPILADVVRGPLRLLLSGPTSSGAAATPETTSSTGRNRIQLAVADLDAEIDGCAAPGCRSAATWSPAASAARFCSPIPPATSSSPSRPGPGRRSPHRRCPDR